MWKKKTTKSLHMVLIGVDPAFRKGGFWACFLDLDDCTAVFRQFRDVLTFDRFLHSPDAPEFAFVVVENSNLQNKNFDMTGDRGTLARKGRNVGTNQAVSELAVRSAQDRYGVDNVANVSPQKKGAKWPESYFQAALNGDKVRAVNYSGTQDERDAYKLAHMGIYEAKKTRSLFRQRMR